MSTIESRSKMPTPFDEDSSSDEEIIIPNRNIEADATDASGETTMMEHNPDAETDSVISLAHRTEERMQVDREMRHTVFTSLSVEERYEQDEEEEDGTETIDMDDGQGTGEDTSPMPARPDPIPSSDPICSLGQIEGENKCNKIKAWLSGTTPFLPDLTDSPHDIFAMRKALVHAVQHIKLVLYPSSTLLVDSLAGVLDVNRFYIYQGGNRFAWENMNGASFLRETDRGRILCMLQAARKEIVWIKEEIEKLKKAGAEASKERFLAYDPVLGFNHDGIVRYKYIASVRSDMV